MIYASFLFSILILNLPDKAYSEVKCFNVARGESVSSADFLIEKTFLKNNKIHKKIYLSKNQKISKKEVSALTDFTSKMGNRPQGKQFIKDEFLLDFILSKNIKPETVYKVPLKSGSAHFRVKTLTPPFSELRIESEDGVLSANLKHNGLSDMKLNKLHFEKSNLILLPCSLDTRAKIFKNKDVSSFIGDQVAQVIYR